MADRSPFVPQLLGVDDALAEAGFPRFSPWWLAELRRFLLSPASTWVVRVGRRGGKSTSWCKLAIAWALYGRWRVPPGDVAVVPFVSVSRDEATARLRTIEAMLGALGVNYNRRGDEVELRDRRVVFRVVSCTTTAVVGFTSILIIGDEVSRWRDSEGVVNPAAEVIGSLRPTLATQAIHGAFTVLSSSPWTSGDYHAQRFSDGDGDGQLTSSAPTWVANPTVTEEQTHELEADPRVWAREYAAEPQASVSDAFPDGIAHVVAKGVQRRPRVPGVRHGVIFDLGEQRSASAAMAFHFEHRQVGAEDSVARVLVVDCVRVLKPTILRRVTFAAQCSLVADLCDEYDVGTPRGDRHLHDAVGSFLAERGRAPSQEPLGMSLPMQAERSRMLLDRVRGGTIDLVDHPDAVAQLSSAVLRERGGTFILTSADKRRSPDDVLDCLLGACDASFAKLPASGGASGIRFSAPTYSFMPGRGLYETSPGYYYRATRDGGEIRVAPPPGSTLAKISAARRWLAGNFVPEEMATGRSIDDFKAEAVRILHELDG